MGMDFGRLLENNPTEEEERSHSGPPSRSNSQNASSTSLSSIKSSITERTEPVEVSKRVHRNERSSKRKLETYMTNCRWPRRVQRERFPAKCMEDISMQAEIGAS